MPQLQPAPHPPADRISFLSCQVKTKQSRQLIQSSTHHFLCSLSCLLPFSLFTFSLVLHRPSILSYSSWFINDPLGFAYRVSLERLPNMYSTNHHLLTASLLSLCATAKNKWPSVAIWSPRETRVSLSQPCYARCQIRIGGLLD